MEYLVILNLNIYSEKHVMIKTLFKLSLIAILGVMTVILSLNANAWSFKGHQLIAQMAFNRLSPSQQQRAESAIMPVYQALPHKLKDRWARYSISPFAKVAALPDIWRNWKLETVFSRFHAPLPKVLYPYRHQRTATWHYINQPYPNKNCQTIKPRNVTWAISQLETALKTTHNRRSRALIIIFLTHFVGDAHQPLHTMSHVDSLCRGDKGGNSFCLSSRPGRCSNSLHHLWDTAAGYLSHRRPIMSDANTLAAQVAGSVSQAKIHDLNPDSWVAGAYQYAGFIYRTPIKQKPSLRYRHHAREIAKHQLYLASARLSLLLSRWLS